MREFDYTNWYNKNRPSEENTELETQEVYFTLADDYAWTYNLKDNMPLAERLKRKKENL